VIDLEPFDEPDDEPDYDRRQKVLVAQRTRDLLSDWAARPAPTTAFCVCRLLGRQHRGFVNYAPGGTECVPPYMDHPLLLLPRDERGSRPMVLVYNPYQDAEKIAREVVLWCEEWECAARLYGKSLSRYAYGTCQVEIIAKHSPSIWRRGTNWWETPVGASHDAALKELAREAAHGKP